MTRVEEKVFRAFVSRAMSAIYFFWIISNYDNQIREEHSDNAEPEAQDHKSWPHDGSSVFDYLDEIQKCENFFHQKRNYDIAFLVP